MSSLVPYPERLLPHNCLLRVLEGLSLVWSASHVFSALRSLAFLAWEQPSANYLCNNPSQLPEILENLTQDANPK